MPVLGVVIGRAAVEDISFSQKDRDILRCLAEKKAEIAQQSCQKEKRELWRRHNDLEKTEPLIFCDPENGWHEIITELDCEGLLARCYEQYLKKDIFWGERMGDDRVVEPFVNVPLVFEQSALGLPVELLGGEDNGSYTWNPPLDDYAKLSMLRPYEITVDMGKSHALMALISDTFEPFLIPKQHTDYWWSLGMTRELIMLRGMEQLMLDFYVYPDRVKEVMAFLRDSNMKKLDILEGRNLLSFNGDDTYIGSGGFGYTNQLTATCSDGAVSCGNMWGFAESQETVGVSPDMFEEFIFPYQLPILERFGLNAYGCCEPLDIRWHVVKKIPRLRRVSISRWCEPERAAQLLQGNYVYSYKPNPSYLARHEMEQDAVRRELEQVLTAAHDCGCRLEIIMKDNHTLGKNPENALRWCSIAREMSDRIWK